MRARSATWGSARCNRLGPYTRSCRRTSVRRRGIHPCPCIRSCPYSTPCLRPPRLRPLASTEHRALAASRTPPAHLPTSPRGPHRTSIFRALPCFRYLSLVSCLEVSRPCSGLRRGGAAVTTKTPQPRRCRRWSAPGSRPRSTERSFHPRRTGCRPGARGSSDPAPTSEVVAEAQRACAGQRTDCGRRRPDRSRDRAPRSAYWL